MIEVLKDGKVATVHATQASADQWINMMKSAGMVGYTTKEVK